MVQGFFQSWDSFVFLGIFSPSEDETYDSFSELPDGFHFAERVGESKVEVVLTKEALLTDMKLTSSSTIADSQPQFTKTDKNLWLMTSVDNDFNNGAMKVNVQIQYQPVEGFQLPGQGRIPGDYSSSGDRS